MALGRRHPHIELMPLLDPLLHHLGERRPPFGGQAGATGVGELLDDLDTVVAGPLADLLLLNGDGVLLAVLGRMDGRWP